MDRKNIAIVSLCFFCGLFSTLLGETAASLSNEELITECVAAASRSNNGKVAFQVQNYKVDGIPECLSYVDGSSILQSNASINRLSLDTCVVKEAPPASLSLFDCGPSADPMFSSANIRLTDTNWSAFNADKNAIVIEKGTADYLSEIWHCGAFEDIKNRELVLKIGKNEKTFIIRGIYDGSRHDLDFASLNSYYGNVHACFIQHEAFSELVSEFSVIAVFSGTAQKNSWLKGAMDQYLGEYSLSVLQCEMNEKCLGALYGEGWFSSLLRKSRAIGWVNAAGFAASAIALLLLVSKVKKSKNRIPEKQAVLLSFISPCSSLVGFAAGTVILYFASKFSLAMIAPYCLLSGITGSILAALIGFGLYYTKAHGSKIWTDSYYI